LLDTLAILRPKEEFANGEEKELFSGQEVPFDKQRVAREREFAELANKQSFLLNNDTMPRRELTNVCVACKAAAAAELANSSRACMVAAKEELTNGSGASKIAAAVELTNGNVPCKEAAAVELTNGSLVCKTAAKEELTNGSGACKVAAAVELTNGRLALLKSQVVAAEKQLSEKLDELADMEEEYTASQARGAPTAELADAYAVCMQEIHRLIEEVSMLYFLMLLD
jgi:hypothetical protein